MKPFFAATCVVGLVLQGCTRGRAAAPPALGRPAQAGPTATAPRGSAAEAPAGGPGARAHRPAPATARGQRGRASYYGASLQGHKTASGEPFDLHAMTAAHRTLPLGTRVRVTNLENGRQVVVRINDRGPYAQGRIIDLSEEAARRLGCLEQGVAEVRVERIDGGLQGRSSR